MYLLNDQNFPIHYDLTLPDGIAQAPLVIFAHGIKGFKDWGFWKPLALRFAENGIASIAFNFSHNGIGSEKWNEFTRLDLFEQNTYSHELSDLKCLLDAVSTGEIGNGALDMNRIALLGHSRGGGIATIFASEDSRIKALVTWNAIGDFFARFTPQQVADWQTKGFTEIRNDRTGQMMRMGKVLYDDALENAARLDTRAAAKRIAIPWLIVHATDDNVVPFSNAMTLFNHASPKTRLLEAIGQHAFGASHPQTLPLPDSLEQVVSASVDFVDTALNLKSY